jgi:hypothetical protein
LVFVIQLWLGFLLILHFFCIRLAILEGGG